MRFGRGRVTFLAKKNSEKAKLPQICISFGGSMPIAQIKRCHLTPPSTPLEKFQTEADFFPDGVSVSVSFQNT